MMTGINTAIQQSHYALQPDRKLEHNSLTETQLCQELEDIIMLQILQKRRLIVNLTGVTRLLSSGRVVLLVSHSSRSSLQQRSRNFTL